MNYFKIYDDMPCLWAKYQLPQKLSQALGESWIVEFYTLDGGKRMSLSYSSVENPDGIDTFDIKNDKVFIFWNLYWTNHEDLNEKQREHYLDLLRLGAKIEIMTYSAYASYKERVDGNQIFIDKFGEDVVYKDCISTMEDEYYVNEIVKKFVEYFEKEDFV
jgi:hypothetical protein